jgi:hypothetical protein|tara:strand:+ start:183 stop:365 length:183 start_codon:yes stop_codon:yes gene_type:complete
MKVFITEFKLGDEFYEGPRIVAESFEDAEVTAELYEVNVVGLLDVIVTEYNEDSYKRVLH